jgi:hypothetical protein
VGTCLGDGCRGEVRHGLGVGADDALAVAAQNVG